MSTDSARQSWKIGNLSSPIHVATLVFLVGLMSYFASLLGSSLRVPPRMISPLWPGNALLIAVLLLVPRKIWPALITVALGVFLLTGLQAGVPIATVSWLILGDLVEVLIAAFGVSSSFNQSPRLNTTNALARYSFFAVGLAPLASAFLGATSGFHANYWLYWKIWFFSEVLALLILAPAVLSFVNVWESWAQKSGAYFIEAAASFTSTMFLAYFLFIFSGRNTPPALLYSLVPFLLWSALRFGSVGITASMILIAFVSLWGAAHGRGPFTALGPLTNVLSLQLFLLFIATPFMVLAVLVQEHRQAEQALRNSEEKFSKAFRESPMEVIGRTTFDISIWVDPTHRLEFVNRLLAGGVIRNLEIRYCRKDGAQRVALGSAELIEIGNEPCVLSVIADITERKQAEEALSLANDRLRLAMESGRAVGWEWDIRSGRAVRFGDLHSVYGIPSETCCGQIEDFYQRVHPDDRQRVAEAVAEAQRDHKPYAAEFRIIHADGTLRWLAARGNFYYAPNGSAERMLGTAMDVTERKHAEERLREYEKAIESAEEMIAVVDREYRYVIANHAFLSHGNMTRDQVVGRRVSEILNEGVFETVVKEKLDDCFQGRVVRFEMQYIYPGLGKRDLFLSYFPIEGPTGVDRAACILQDITERKQAEQALRQTKEELVEAQRVAHLGSWQWDVTIGAITWSKELYRIHGLDPTLPAPSEKELAKHFTPESWNQLSLRMREMVQMGSVQEFDLEVVRPDGSRRWVSTRGEAVRDNSGRVTLIRGIVRDITERKQIEDELHESQNRLRAVVASAMDAIIAINEEQRIVLFNVAAEKMFGCSASDAIGSSIERFIPERFRAGHRVHIRHLGDTGVTNRSIGTLLYGLRANGEEFRIEASISHIRSDGKRLFTVIIRDVTARLQAEESVRESEERFRLVANTAPVMIWMSGPDKQCNYFNQPWLEFTGRSLEAELGNGWAEGVHAEDLKRCLDIYTRSFDQRESFKMQYRLRRHDGEYRWVLDIGVPRFNPDSSFAGYIGSCIDITDRKLAEEALADMGRRLIEAHEEERSWIARDLHDDINQRIALLAIELEQLKQNLPESAVDSHDHIRQLGERLSDVGKDIQALSHRLHSSKLEYLGIVAATSSFCKELSEQQKVEIDFSHSGILRSVPKEISLCLFRVLQEALQNAVKHSGVRRFRVELHGTSGEIHLSVSDSGVGFDPAAAISSRGLGLISMQERVHLIDGDLAIESQPSGGTRIRVRASLKTRKSLEQAAG
jgi:PAS domain S-box-containing protein